MMFLDLDKDNGSYIGIVWLSHNTPNHKILYSCESGASFLPYHWLMASAEKLKPRKLSFYDQFFETQIKLGWRHYKYFRTIKELDTIVENHKKKF